MKKLAYHHSLQWPSMWPDAGQLGVMSGATGLIRLRAIRSGKSLKMSEGIPYSVNDA